jgi:pantetheine-phosphate adenylyltransferase
VIGRSAPRIAVCPGSFDPLTNGHVDLIRRATRLFDRVIVTVLVNTGKEPLFSTAERVELARAVFAADDQIEVDTFDGLLVDYAQRRGASAIVRGLRGAADVEYERPMVFMNRRIGAGMETVFLLPEPDVGFISSTLVKEIARMGGDVAAFVPAVVADGWRAKRGT